MNFRQLYHVFLIFFSLSKYYDVVLLEFLISLPNSYLHANLVLFFNKYPMKVILQPNCTFLLVFFTLIVSLKSGKWLVCFIFCCLFLTLLFVSSWHSSLSLPEIIVSFIDLNIISLSVAIQAKGWKPPRVLHWVELILRCIHLTQYCA